MTRSALVLWLAFPAATVLAQSARPHAPPTCGGAPVEGCRDARERFELRARECIARLEQVSVGYYDDSAGAVLLSRRLEAAVVAPDGGVGHVETITSERQVEGASENFELWKTPAGALLHTSRSVYPAGADYELGPMDTAQSLEWVTVDAACRVVMLPVGGTYVDQGTRERLSLSAPTLPHGGAKDERLRVEYSSPKRPGPVRLEVRSFDPEHRTVVVAFRSKEAYRLQLEPRALLVTPVAGGKTQRFVRED